VGGQRGETEIRAAKSWKVSLSDAQGNPQGKKQQSLRLRFTPHQIASVVFEAEIG
jgi:hypothetical protein